MRGITHRGFTVVEVMLFLAISGLLLIIAFTGTGVAIERARFQDASRQIGDWRLNGCHIYVTVEPCIMCMGAILQSRISKIIIGTFNKDMGACGSVINLADNSHIGRFISVIWSYDERCSNLMNSFFEEKRLKY